MCIYIYITLCILYCPSSFNCVNCLHRIVWQTITPPHCSLLLLTTYLVTNHHNWGPLRVAQARLSLMRSMACLSVCISIVRRVIPFHLSLSKWPLLTLTSFARTVGSPPLEGCASSIRVHEGRGCTRERGQECN